MSSRYRLAKPVVVRLTGGLVVSLAVLVIVLAVVVGLAGWPFAVVLRGVLVAVAAGAAAGLALWLLAVVVSLDDSGYRVRFVRGAGVTAAAWTEVADAVTAESAGHSVVVLRLTDGRTTTIPVGLLAGDREQFVRDLQGHLNRGQGYRPLS